MFATMTANELYRHIISHLESIYPRPEASQICSILFENKAGIALKDLIKEPALTLDETTVLHLKDSLEALLRHTPIQYVTGEAWFYKMKLVVSPAVLIPRPETEELADNIIRYLKGNPAASLLDIGTGSGCIAIAVKRNSPGTSVTAIDLSEEALAIAKQNAGFQEAMISFAKADFLDENTWDTFPTFDVIVSNPPYIPLEEKTLLDKQVTAFEPHLALFVDNDRPLIFYEQIALFGQKHLNPNGRIFLETHEHYAEAVAALFSNEYYSPEIVLDINGKQRMLVVTYHHR